MLTVKNEIAKTNKRVQALKKDLGRTYPSLPVFKDNRVQIKLKNVLRAFSNYEPNIKYFQGMNFIVQFLYEMYGEEDAQSDDTLNLPPERSLEGIKKWKKSIIISAGVIVNAVLAIVLFAIADLCFMTIKPTNIVKMSDSSVFVVEGIEDGDRLSYITYEQTINGKTSEYMALEGETNYYYVIDDDVDVGAQTHYVLAYAYYTDKTNNNLSAGLALFDGYLNDDATITKDGSSSFYLPNLDSKPNQLVGEYPLSIDFTFVRVAPTKTTIPVTINLTYKDGVFDDVGLELLINKFYKPFGERFNDIWVDFGESSVAIVKALGTLFTPKGIGEVSSIVGIFKTSNQILKTRTFATYLKMWGMISVNLAIFNLLPFPGLDGWQLLVTAIEGISKKKVPTKFKAIMNLIGFGLLLSLMVLIVIKDIVMW